MNFIYLLSGRRRHWLLTAWTMLWRCLHVMVAWCLFFYFIFYFFLSPCLHNVSVWVVILSTWNQSLLTQGRAAGTWRRPWLFMSRCDPLCHPCQREVSVCNTAPYSLYQPGVSNESHQVNTTTETATALKPLNSFRRTLIESNVNHVMTPTIFFLCMGCV